MPVKAPPKPPRVPCPHEGCTYSAEPGSSIAGHLSMAHHDRDALVVRSEARLDDQEWLDARIAAIETGVEAVVDIARNWTDGRNLSRLHPGVSAAEYVTARVGTLGKAVVPVLLAESNWSNRQIASVAGVSEGAVRLEVRRSTQVDPRPVLGADNKVYQPRTVTAVVIDTPIEEEAMEAAVSRTEAKTDRQRAIALANRDRLVRGLSMVDGACTALADLNFEAIASAAGPGELESWARQVAGITVKLRRVRRSLEGDAQ